MNQQTIRRWAATVGLGTFCAMLAGCAGFQTQTATPVLRAPLDGEHVIELRQYCQFNETMPGEQHNFATLGIYLARHPEDPGVGATVMRKAFFRAEDFEEFDLTGLELRTNRDRDKVWLVDVPQQRVVATLDCITGYVTGPVDPPPDWASPWSGYTLRPDPFPYEVARGGY